MIESIVEAVSLLVTWPLPVYLVVGTLIGLIFGALPGLGGVIALSLLVPFTFGMDTTEALVLFGGTLGGTAFGGSISAILLNIPGTPPNVATTIDGYPMTQRGRGREALAISATASMLGAIFGIVILLFLIPVAREVILMFSAPEFFWLALLGLVVIAVTARGRLLKGLIIGGFAFMLAMIGFSDVTAELRYSFGTLYFYDGIQLIPAIIGLYAISEIIDAIAKGGKIAEDADGDGDGEVKIEGSVFQGIKRVFQNPSTLLRSSAIGAIVGIVPGVGGVTANFIAYMQTSQTAKDKSEFGKGDPRGVIATESSNDAKDGGALLPTLLFGIPGSAAMAVILGGLLLHGVTPGPSMLREDLALIYLIIFALLVSNVLTSAIGLATANQLAKITRVRVELLAPAILVVSFIGAYVLRLNTYDVMIALAFGFFGYVLITLNYSRIPVVLALILADITETAFHQSIQISDVGYLIFVTRPIAFVLFLLTILSIVYPFRSELGQLRDPSTLRAHRQSLTRVPRNVYRTYRPIFSLSYWNQFTRVEGILDTDTTLIDRAFAFSLLAVVVVMLALTPLYRPDTRLFPLVIGIPTALLLIGLMLKQTSPGYDVAAGTNPMFDEVVESGESEPQTVKRKRALAISAWVMAAFLSLYIIGMILGSLVFLVVYYLRFANSRVRALLYAGAIWVAVFVLFGEVLGAPLYEGWILDTFVT